MGISISNQLLGSTGLSVGLGLSRGGGLYFAGFGGATPPFTPASLFTSGAPGFLLDATLADLSSLFQDSAGTIPVTAVEQSVGRVLDTSGRGNHFVQSTSAARPVLSARVNLLTKTEDFSDPALWIKFQCTASAMNVSDPIGGTTASTVTATSANAFFYYALGPNNPTSGTALNSVWLRRRTGTGAVRIRSNASVGGEVETAVAVTGTWQLFQMPCIPGNVGSQNCFVINIAVSGDAIDVWHPDLRLSNAGVGLPNYQRVNTATDYATTGFPIYLRYDGTDDFLVSAATVNFSTTAQMSVFAGVRKLSDPAAGIVFETSGTVETNAGTTIVFTNPNIYGIKLRGSLNPAAVSSPSSYTAPITNLLTALGDIPADSNILRLNGLQVASSSADLGTGNFGNYLNYIGMRGGVSLPLNGRIYFPLVVLGRTATATEIANMESYLSASMGGGYVPTGYDFLVTGDGDQLTDASGNALYTIPLYS